MSLSFLIKSILVQNPKGHNLLLTVSMSLRLSTSCLLSLISLDATHVLIWSRRRWGHRRKEEDGEKKRSGRDKHISDLCEACRNSSLAVTDGEKWCVREACGAWLGRVWSSWQHGAGSRRTKHHVWLRKEKFDTPPRSTHKQTANCGHQQSIWARASSFQKFSFFSSWEIKSHLNQQMWFIKKNLFTLLKENIHSWPESLIAPQQQKQQLSFWEISYLMSKVQRGKVNFPFLSLKLSQFTTEKSGAPSV